MWRQVATSFLFADWNKRAFMATVMVLIDQYGLVRVTIVHVDTFVTVTVASCDFTADVEHVDCDRGRPA